MRSLLISFLVLFGATLSAAQKSETDPALVGTPLLVRKTVNITFRTTFDGKPVPVERIDAPDKAPLRLAVIDLRETAPESTAERLLPELFSTNLRKLRAVAAFIKIGRQANEEIRLPVGWKFYASSDLETALREAESFFASGNSGERQSLLIIKNSSHPVDIPEFAQLNAAMPSAAAKLITIVTDGAAENTVKPLKKILGAQIKQWRDSLFLFYVIRIAADTIPPTGGRIEVEAVSGNKIVGRGSKQINPSPSFDEVEAAFADYARIVTFETLKKYPGLSEADLKFYRSHYAPPIEGVVVALDATKNERLKALSESVFRLHGVEKQCLVVLLESRVPTVFTWKLSFVSLTTKDLEILNDDEITALIAHEIGHLYFADDLLKARLSGDDRLARVAELKCDLLALETLRRLKINEENLPSAIQKLIKARSAMNLKNPEAGSPSVDDRRRIARKYIENRKQVG